MPYIAKVMQEKQGRTVLERAFATLEEAKACISRYRSRHKYAKTHYVSRITEYNASTIIRSYQFELNRWVCIG